MAVYVHSALSFGVFFFICLVIIFGWSLRYSDILYISFLYILLAFKRMTKIQLKSKLKENRLGT